jgi:hypothetical protein
VILSTPSNPTNLITNDLNPSILNIIVFHIFRIEKTIANQITPNFSLTPFPPCPKPLKIPPSINQSILVYREMKKKNVYIKMECIQMFIEYNK